MSVCHENGRTDGQSVATIGEAVAAKRLVKFKMIQAKVKSEIKSKIKEKSKSMIQKTTKFELEPEMI